MLAHDYPTNLVRRHHCRRRPIYRLANASADAVGRRFVEMISMIVSFSVDKERMMSTVTWLGFRHVRYGVRPHHIPIMGQVPHLPRRLPHDSALCIPASIESIFANV